ncbi:MAG: hypothetical protein HKP16_07570 [Xanthomonadales bacterium]|nr:hypothetical protein [Xanthomonadales bacterium]
MRRPAALLTILLALPWFTAAWADGHLDVEYAEQQPLATESMLLDVTRVGQRIVAVGERGHVVLSDDGLDWEQAEHVPTRSTLTTVISHGSRLWAAGHDAVILTSGDGGGTWSLLNFEPDRQQAVMDLHFTSETDGVAIGSYGLYLVTRDGGKTWEDGSVDPENDYHLNSMVRFPDGRRMIAGEAGYSYRSPDDGETWEPLDLPYLGSMWGAVVFSGDCVIFFGLRGHAMESCDFGDTWFEMETGTQASLSGAVDHEGMLVFAGNSGTVLTRSGGPISVHTHSSGVDFAAVLPLSGGRFLLVGEDGAHFFPENRVNGDDE